MGVTHDALLSAYVTSFIQFKARQICHKPGFSRSDEPDIVQQLTTYLLQQADKYDPSRASVETFANRVVVTGVAMILRDRWRSKRAAGFTTTSIESGTVEMNGEEESLADVLTDADKARVTGVARPDGQAHLELVDAMKHALAELPPAIAEIAEALKHDTAASVAKKLNVSRRRVDAAKDQIANMFREVGLGFEE